VKKSGSRLGPYEIQSSIGAGGMGEVYRARDTRLDRVVAIKVIAGAVALDPAFRERFDREARAVSALDHPHICTLYDVGHENGIAFLVMQYLEGETLADRLARGSRPGSDGTSGADTSTRPTSNTPLTPELALRYGAEIASALNAAHRAGIVHRDLKPGNIILTKTGAKLLDFGLAKLAEEPLVAGVQPVTRTVPLTAAGSIVGTLNYMSPEQLEGRPIDARTDIFSFGAVLFEMLTGRRAFDADSHAGLIAAILNGDPAVARELVLESPLSPPVLRALERLVGRCLAKDPDERWQSSADLGAELQWINEERLRSTRFPEPETVDGPQAGRSRTRTRLMMTTGAAALLIIGGLAAWKLRPPPPDPEVVSFDISEDQTRFEPFASGPGALAVSPDGRRIAVASGSATTGQLAVRWLGSTEIVQLPGTEGAFQPFWSADGRSVAFAKRLTGQLQAVSLTGGALTTLAENVTGRGAWGSDNVLLFSRNNGGLYWVPQAGGRAAVATKLDKAAGEVDHLWPQFLPDGRRFLYVSLNREPANSAIVLASLDAPERRELVKAHSSFELSADHLLFQRGGTIYAQPFDAREGQLTGDVRPIVQGVAYNAANGRAAFSTGGATLVYRPGLANSGEPEMRWYDLDGKVLATITSGLEGVLRNHDVSADGTRVVVQQNETGGGVDIYVIDAVRSVATRVTSDPATDTFPIWSVDDRYVYFASGRDGRQGLYRRASDGSGSDELLLASEEQKVPMSVSSDGQLLLYSRREARKPGDIWALRLTGDRTPHAVLTTPYEEAGASLSPDGKWLAYHSNDLGSNQVYAQAFPGGGHRIRISNTSGAGPVWSADGQAIYYLSSDGDVMAARVTVAGDTLRALPPRLLFTPGGLRIGARNLGFDARGKRFLLMTSPDERRSAPLRLSVVVNWPSYRPSSPTR
jgi:serine/threonine protein kinase/Tol biopolymer transport system component